VDWLGRGGIAQTSDQWIRTLMAAGADVSVATRRGRDLSEADHGARVLAPPRWSIPAPMGQHVALVALVCRHIAQDRPDVVILQNYVLPELELPVLLAARRYQARSVLVAHESQTRYAPSGHKRLLATELRHADVVVCHTRFVAGELEQFAGGLPIEVFPLPVVSSVVNKVGETTSLVPPGPGLVGLHLGHLQRSYKGTAKVVQLAHLGVPGWRFALVGTGAPRDVHGVVSVPRFLTEAEVANTVASAAAVVLPYVRICQSAVVSLAQALGTVVVSSSVGGIPEQVPKNTGILLDPDASAWQWRQALLGLDNDARAGITARARELAYANQREFVSGVRAIVSTG